MIKDDVTLTGKVIITLRGPDGKIKERVTRNTVVDSGKQHVANLLTTSSEAAMSHMAIGTSDTPADPSQTALIAEIDPPARQAFSDTGNSKTQGIGSDANKVYYVATFPAGTPPGTNDIKEAGNFNAATGGIMLCRAADFGTKTKGPGDSLTFTWIITVN